ncbi:MAG TPA: branched-chain-amino-acid transaminase [Rhodopirellula baltica]|uniref:Branched-chain-amino-acid aminotransferase n=2 Tax=Rhodopirellula baltica TaxID=265606 RepID=Q7UG48_RHOBA|nr:branched-chain-amino-acid transaminase [Rhodopirellula baltica]ELP34426.1 Branched-chain amino acid aminotransferase I [Rhodopirellula baltica SWK14]CAD78481.1 putative branched-chain amino acid aminotransferase [Rhodopirellula baltica SH 1]HBE61994.1 branched-chain-amino-acid transaminase [Rhodopirellula baltica]
MTQAIYINGEYFSREDAKISVYDHGLLYGDGVFEGMRIYSGKVFALEDHMTRLYESARAIMLDIPIAIDALTTAVNETVAKNGLTEGYIRLVVTRGGNQLGLNPFSCEDPQVIIIADTISLYPEKFYTEGLELITASTIRNHPAALSPRVKSLNYLNNIMAKIEAIRAGCIEAVMLNTKGEVAECTGDNIFIVRGGRLITPPIDAGILEGITRNTVIDLARENGIEVAEEAMTRHDIFVADECFLTGSAAEVIPAVKLDGRVIGDGKPGPMTQKLNAAFRAFVAR